MANFQLQDTFKAPFSVFEFDADNNPTTPTTGDTCTVSSSDTASVTVQQDATPSDPAAIATGFLVGGAKVQNGVVISAAVAHADGSPVSAPTFLVDVVPSAAVNAGISVGVPIPQ